MLDKIFYDLESTSMIGTITNPTEKRKGMQKVMTKSYVFLRRHWYISNNLNLSPKLVNN